MKRKLEIWICKTLSKGKPISKIKNRLRFKVIAWLNKRELIRLANGHGYDSIRF
jgi:hypothetical protein